MTRRYSHLAPSHQQRAVDRLVPVRDLAKRRVRCATKTATEPGVVGTTVTVIACKLFIIKRNAKVAELADAPDLGSGGETRGGSSPPFRTNNLQGIVGFAILVGESVIV